jgi:hypothetical protein
MTALVADQVGRLLPRSARESCLVVGEVPAAVGIADVVVVRFDADPVRHRLESGIGPLCSPLRVRALDALRTDRPTLVRTLARRLGSNARALTRSTLRPLTEMGAVELVGDRVWATGAWQPVGAHLTAVELKLSKWRDALRQADNFSLSADRSWVVLDFARAGAAIAARETFECYGVGLAVLDGAGQLRIITRPHGRRPERWLRALMAERAWAVAEGEVATHAANDRPSAPGPRTAAHTLLAETNALTGALCRDEPAEVGCSSAVDESLEHRGQTQGLMRCR